MTDEYLQQVIARDLASADEMKIKCAPTLGNCEYVRVVGSGSKMFPILRIPEDHLGVVHSASGEPCEQDAGRHAESLVERLMEGARRFGSTPLAFMNVVDYSTGEAEVITCIANALVKGANANRLAILNGESAILGDRVTVPANVSGTLISMIPKNDRRGPMRLCGEDPFLFEDSWYVVFDPQGKAVFGNSDGVGTKLELYERACTFGKGARDSIVMKWDDLIKYGAQGLIAADVVEYAGDVDYEGVRYCGAEMLRSVGGRYLAQAECMTGRLRGYQEGAPVYNLSGSAISLIDEKRLCNPLVPRPGDYLIGIRGKPNPRSNGISAKRKAVSKMGETWCWHDGVDNNKDWHKTTRGKYYLEYLAEPSTFFYPVFKALIAQGLVSAVTHMSGGAYEGKLAKLMAENDLFVRVEGLFDPDPREVALLRALEKKTQDAYAQWPMGTEGFVTSPVPDAAIQAIKRFGLEAKMVGRLEEAKEQKGVSLRAYNGEEVCFSGN